MKDSVTLIQAELERAVAAHNEAVARLYLPSGGPRYSDEVMRQEGQKARQTLTAALDNLHNRAEDIRTTAAATANAARDDPYSWLSDDELQRAALLAPFVAEDVAAADVAELATLGNQIMTGRRTMPRPMAWLLMRAAAARDGVPGSVVRAFEGAAMPPEVQAADKLARDAERVQAGIGRARPEWNEHIRRDILGHAAYDATGQPAELR
jgi:hypothetical protein